MLGTTSAASPASEHERHVLHRDAQLQFDTDANSIRQDLSTQIGNAAPTLSMIGSHAKLVNSVDAHHRDTGAHSGAQSKLINSDAHAKLIHSLDTLRKVGEVHSGAQLVSGGGTAAKAKHSSGTEVRQSDRQASSDSAQNSFQLDSFASAELTRAMADIADTLLMHEGETPGISQFVRAVGPKMDFQHAAQAVEQKELPPDIATLIKVTVKETNQDAKQPFSEESLDRARVVLNDLVEKAWKEMDDKIIECKEFEEQNRGSYSQVMADISRLVEQITDLERISTESLEGINSKDMEITDVVSALQTQTRIYLQIEASNEAEMVERQADMDVFQFILAFTKCPDATSFVQLLGNRSTAGGNTTAHLHSGTAVHKQSAARVCQMHGDKSGLIFADRDLQHKYDSLLTKRSRKIVSDILGQTHKQHVGLVQAHQPMDSEAYIVPVDASPVAGDNGPPCAEEGDPMECMKSCPPTPPDCGLLHDKLSLMWGDYKDKVDELQYAMNRDEMEFHELKANLNDQIKVLTLSKARFSMQLSEARSNLAMDREEKKEKDSQKRDLDQDYYDFQRACKKRIMWIMYQDMCALIVVRNAVLETSTVCPTMSITDCDVDSWISAECSVSCDSTCPDPHDPYACGGWQQIHRKIVVPPDDCGLQCPELTRQKKCNQVKCPDDCELSEWSGWGKCSADCEGGVQSHTRSVLTKPTNGGLACNTVSEARPCHTGSCDRDCTLADWTPWSPCTSGCGGGMQERHRHVLVPTRGFGKCPKRSSNTRFQNQECNAHPCVGDEVCVAKQDLIIAIDGSGSLTEQGFGILTNFATNLVGKYRGEYFGSDAVQIGVILFGNGEIMPDGQSISPAINVQALTKDMELVKEVLGAVPFKKGFTNMAQAFSLADVMYTHASRSEAQSALMVITDGRPSFVFQTNDLVRQLDDKNVQRFFVVVDSGAGEQLEQMKKWASNPWETNLLHIPGLDPLQADQEVWSQKALTLFCPLAFSPAQQAQTESLEGFMHVYSGGFCGERGNLLQQEVEDSSACAALAQGAGASAFLLGKSFRRGYCYASSLEVTETLYNEWLEDRVHPACPSDWITSTIFDFYALMPVPGE